MSAEETRIRRELGDLLVAEYAYWRKVDSESLMEFSMGAMGALSNVLAAELLGLSPEAYRRQIAARDERLPNS